jgi:trans-aconitate methyltransferase
MTINEVYGQIDEQRGVLVNLLNMAKKNPISPNRLSDVCMKLGILNELLGGFVPDLKMAQLAKEEEMFKDAKENLKKSDTAAKELARWGSKAERLAFEKADMKHTDLWKLISMAQSHIRAEGEERKNL